MSDSETDDTGFFEGLYDRTMDSVTHSARQIEDAIDTDNDGSVLDDFMGGAIKEVPYVGETIGAVGEEFGDFATDAMGTRHQGVFSQEGTWSAESTDVDYAGDGHFDGTGQYLNDELGIGQNDPKDIMYGVAAASLATANVPGALVYGGIAALGDEVEDRQDPYATPSESTEYYEQTPDWLYGETTESYESTETGESYGGGYVESYGEGYETS